VFPGSHKSARILGHALELCENFGQFRDDLRMKAVIQLFWRMCLLRQSPAHVPTMPWFVATVVAANLLVSVVVSVSIDQSLGALNVLTRVVVGQATYACLVWLATYLRQHPERFPATLTALFGCDLIITAVFGVLVPLATTLDLRLVEFLSLVFMIWSLTVAGYILSRALDVQTAVGILLALGMSVLSVVLSVAAVGAG